MTNVESTFDYHGLILPTKFRSYAHYEQIKRSLEEHPSIESVPVSKPASNVGFHECWFRLKGAVDTIRIVEPDAPFRGIIEVVPVNDTG